MLTVQSRPFAPGSSKSRCGIKCNAAFFGEPPAVVARRIATATLTTALSLSLLVPGADARLDPVNRPDLLPKLPTPVIDVANFLGPAEEQRLKSQIEKLERDTGFKLRVLAQSYPLTPGKAIQKFWQMDENTVLMVADPTFGDMLNFNVGRKVDTEVPEQFWGRLAGTMGSKFYWQARGEADTILDTVNVIDLCMHEPSNKAKCGVGHLKDKLTPSLD